MKSFAIIIICVGGNDCSSRLSKTAFEEKYDQLISFIQSANRDCAIYLSKVLPRGDIDVAEFNRSRVADHWAMHQVKCIEDTSSLFFGQNGLPSSRYFSNDGIHLSHSGIKRRFDALNRHIGIVSDFTSRRKGLSHREPVGI